MNNLVDGLFINVVNCSFVLLLMKNNKISENPFR